MRFIGYRNKKPSYDCSRIGKCTSLVRRAEEENTDRRSMEVGVIRMGGGEDECLGSISCNLIRRRRRWITDLFYNQTSKWVSDENYRPSALLSYNQPHCSSLLFKSKSSKWNHLHSHLSSPRPTLQVDLLHAPRSPQQSSQTQQWHCTQKSWSSH